MTDLDSIIDAAAQQHPQPSDVAPTLVQEARAEFGVSPAAGDGVAGPPGWDARIHVSPPTRTTRGTWKLLRRPLVDPVTLEPPGPDFDAAAAAMCDTVFGIVPAMLGEKWEPTPGERRNIEASLVRYFKANGAIDIPPGVALTLAVGAYALPRLPIGDWIGGLMGGGPAGPVVETTTQIPMPGVINDQHATDEAGG